MQDENLPIDESFFQEMYFQWNLKKMDSETIASIGKSKFRETVGNINLYSLQNRVLRREIIDLENQIMELEGRLGALLGGYSVLANALIHIEISGMKKRALGKFLMIVSGFSQITLDKMLALHEVFNKVRDELDNLEK